MDDLYAQQFMKMAWKIMPHTYAAVASGGKWTPFKFLEYISNIIFPLLVEGNARIIIEAPPRHGKSNFCSHWLPIWYLDMFHEQNIMMASYSHDLATDFGRKIRDEIQYNPHIDVGLNPSAMASNDFATNRGGRLVATGVGGTMTGRGAHLMILDDLYKDWLEAQSQRIRENRWGWWESTAETRLEPNGSVILISTRWHKQDLTGKLLEEEGDIKEGGKWTILKFPALCENPEVDLIGRKVDEALVPERYSAEHLKGIRDKRSKKIWTSLYQQQPTDTEGGIIKREMFQFFTKRPESFDHIITSWDLTFKGKSTSDWVVGGVVGKKGGDYYLLDVKRKQMGYVETKESVKLMAKKWPMIFSHIIEDKANGPAIIDDLKNVVTGLEAFNPRVSKTERLELVSPVFSSGNFHLPDPALADWVEPFMEELICYNRELGDNQVDDQVDMISQALIKLQGGFDWLRGMTKM